MMVNSIILLFLIILMSRSIKSRSPGFSKRIEFPALIILSVIVTVYCGFCVYGVYDVVMSGISVDDKVFFVIFMGIVIVVYMVMVIRSWKNWLMERKDNSLQK